MKRVVKIILILISFIILLVGAFFLFTALWVRRTWSKLSASSIIFQLQNSLEGTGNGMIKTFILTAVLPTVILTAACIVLFFLMKRKRRYMIIYAAVGAGLFVLSLSLLWKRIGLGDYLKYRNKKSTFIEDNYVAPEDTRLSFPEKKRNVIYIYLESMEVTYADKEHGGMMEESLIPNLTGLLAEAKLNGAYSMYGTDWTMGAMFAETSGLPLIIPIQKNSMFTQGEFFPTVRTFGDILSENGYRNILLYGHDSEFGGSDLYFGTHGNYEIHDYKYAKSMGWIPKDYMVFWGYEDEKLFQFAKKELEELSASEEPFNLTMLTVDTHFEDGYYCRLCEDRFDDQYKNVIACSDRQVAAFVEWCKQQDFYENTTIIISGDHPTMDMDFNNEFGDTERRKVYINIINPAEKLKVPESERAYTTFDLFPTSLAAMGVKIDGDRLGLGTNLFSDKQTLLEETDFTEFNTQLKMKSDMMTKLSNIDEESAESFLDAVDDELRKLKVDFNLEETNTTGRYKVSVSLLTDRPSTINYIKTPYITVTDGTYEYSYLMKYNNDYSISDGKTCYEAYINLPLTENNDPEDIEDGFLSSLQGDDIGGFDNGSEKNNNDTDSISEKPVENETGINDPADENTPADGNIHWKGSINISFTINTHNETSISSWEENFEID